MVFDEIDRGVGGAVASAVGERLARLASGAQLLVVTHSPQVAARARHHWLIAKDHDGTVTRTGVRALDPAERREEIARMLSGARSDRRSTGAGGSAARSSLNCYAAWSFQPKPALFEHAGERIGCRDRRPPDLPLLAGRHAAGLVRHPEIVPQDEIIGRHTWK